MFLRSFLKKANAFWHLVILISVFKLTPYLFRWLIMCLPTIGMGQIVFDQSSGIINDGIASQDFEVGNNVYDCEAADDFIVPPGSNWTLDSVEIFGQYSNLSTNMGFRFRIYHDDSGGPGGVFYEAEILANADPDGDGNVMIYFECPLQISSGAYWVGAQAIKDLSGGGQWYWLRDSVGSNAVFQWKNPPGGFGTSCFSFTPINVCATAITEPGTAFKFYGCAGGPDLDLLPQDTVVCANSFLVLQPDTSVGLNHSFLWNTGDSTATLVADSSREYRVSVTDTTTGCYTARCANIDVVHIPNPAMLDDTICETGGATSGAFFSVACINCINIWNQMDTNNALYGYSEPGAITRLVIDTVVGCFEIDTAMIELEQVPISISPAKSNEICLGDTIELSTTQGPYSYLWSVFTDPGWAPIADSMRFQTWSSGIFSIVVTSERGCTAMDTVEVLVNPNPFPVIQQAWSGDSVILFTSEEYSAYVWSDSSSQASIYPDSNGVYAVTVTDSNGCVGVDDFEVIVVSTTQNRAQQIRIYPNPSEGVFFIDSPQSAKGYDLRIIDMSGRTLILKQWVSGSGRIDMRNFPKGIYTVIADQGGEVLIRATLVNL